MFEAIGGALDCLVRGHQAAVLRGRGAGAAPSEEADGQEALLSQGPSDAGIWAEASGGAFWRGVKFTEEHVLALLEANSHFALRWSDQPSWFARGRGASWDASLSVFKPRQSRAKLDRLISVAADDPDCSELGDVTL